MLKILITLIIIRLRKLVSKDDYLAYGIILAIHLVGLGYISNILYQKNPYYILFLSLEILGYHSNRNDLELLKLRKDYFFILFCEYLLYSLSVIIVILTKKDFLHLIAYLSLIIFFILLPGFKSKIIKFPFRFFDSFWTISFRKDKLYLFIPIVIFISVMGYKSNNTNLNFFCLIATSFICSIPYFNRESLDQIKISHYIGSSYLKKHIITAVYNSLFLTIPLLGTLLFFKNWGFLYFLPAIFLLPVTNILFKYAFFDNRFISGLFFILFLANISSGIPLLLLPFLYHYALKKIKSIQNAPY
jgi:hypothetical protein